MSNFNYKRRKTNDNPVKDDSRNLIDSLFTDDLDDLLVQATQQADDEVHFDIRSEVISHPNAVASSSLFNLQGEVSTLRAKCEAEEERNRELLAKHKKNEDEKNQQISELIKERENLKTQLQFKAVQNLNISFNQPDRCKTSPKSRLQTKTPNLRASFKVRVSCKPPQIPQSHFVLFSSILKEPVPLLSCVQYKCIDSELKQLAHCLVEDDIKISVAIFISPATKIIESIDEYISMQLTPKFSIAMGQKHERIELEGHALLLKSRLFDVETRTLSPYTIYDNHQQFENEEAIPVRRFIAILAMLCDRSMQFFNALPSESILKLIAAFKKFTVVRNSHLYTGIYHAGTSLLCSLASPDNISIDKSILFQLANAIVRGCTEIQSLEKYSKFLFQISTMEDNVPFINMLCNNRTCGYHLIDNITDNRFNAFNTDTCVIQLFASIIRAEYQDNPKLCPVKCDILFKTTMNVMKFLINCETFDAEWTWDSSVKGRWTCFNTYAFTTITLLHVLFSQFSMSPTQTKDDVNKIDKICSQIPMVQRILKFDEFNKDSPYHMPSSGRHRLKDVNCYIIKYLKSKK